jgi:ABC-type methionine transport system ATPase subunit
MTDLSKARQRVAGGLKITDLRSPLAGPFTLEVPAGRVVAVSGASGAGKSLFLRMVADLDPSDGEVSLAGVARSSLPGLAPARPLRRRRVRLVGERRP